MARTLFRVMRGEFAFYLTEGSKGARKEGRAGPYTGPVDSGRSRTALSSSTAVTAPDYWQ